MDEEEQNDKTGFTLNITANTENGLVSKKGGKGIQTDNTDYLWELKVPRNLN